MRTIRPVLAALLACSAASAQTPTPADVSTIMASAERQRQAGDNGAALAALEDAAAAYPGQALPLFNLGAVYGELGRYEEAAGALRRGLALDPGNADAHLTLAKARIGLHDYAGALDSAGRYAEIAGAAASNFDFHYVRGVGLRRLARLDEAEAELRKAVALNDGHADALYNLGFVCSRRGRYDEARALLENARRIDPESQDIRYRLAAVLKKLGETAAAARELDAFREAKERAQRQTRAAVSVEQGRRALQGGDAQKAKDFFQQAIRHEADNTEAHNSLGVAYGRLGRNDLAELMFAKAIALRADYAEAHVNLALTLAARGKLDEARTRIEEALRLEPENPAAHEAAGMILTRLGRAADALPHFRKVAAARPEDAAARLNVGIALAESRRTAEALAEFARAVEMSPDAARPRYNRGRALRDLGRTDEAVAELRRAVAIDSGFASALEALASIEAEQGDFERSAELWARAVELRPENADARYDLGRSLMQLGRKDAAVTHWRRAAELDPAHREALYNLAQALHRSDPESARGYRLRFQALKSEEQVTDRAGTLWNFALAAAAKKDWEQAFSLFQQALDVCGDCPARGGIHKNFGLTYGHAGDYANAERELEAARELLPDDGEIARALAIVRASGGRTQ